MLRAIGDHHDLMAGICADVLQPDTITVGDLVRTG